MLGMLVNIFGNAARKVSVEVQNERNKDPKYQEEQRRKLQESMDRNDRGQAVREMLKDDK